MTRSAPAFALLAALGLSACGPGPREAAPAAAERDPNVAGYLAPPSVNLASRDGERVVLNGEAPPGSRVRLAAPGGEPLFAEVDRRGAWTLALAPSAGPRIFGLSATSEGRTVQAKGYLLVTGAGRAVLLRAGAGALVIGGGSAARVTAVDFDQAGGITVSGRAEPETDLNVRLDGRQRAEGRSDGEGRFAIALPEVAPGRHEIEVLGRGVFGAVVEVTPVAAVPGAFRAYGSGGALRVDWRTPGGGLQSTLILPGA